MYERIMSAEIMVSKRNKRGNASLIIVAMVTSIRTLNPYLGRLLWKLP
jgi:hypothetical protein